jgi:hypothetical protein
MPDLSRRTLFTLLLPPATALAQLPDYIPAGPEVVLNTDSCVVQPTSGPPLTVVGGVFRFRNVTINQGVLVRGVGSRPMIWLVDNMTIGGVLTVSGGDGDRVNTLNSANFRASAASPARQPAAAAWAVRRSRCVRSRRRAGSVRARRPVSAAPAD